MPRKQRTQPWLSECCYHVSNTCYNPASIFRFDYMRQLAVKRLLELKKRHHIKFMDYLLHPEGYRFLIEAEHPGHISEALRSFHLGTTHDYCSRKNWEGSVWRQRASTITLVQKGHHALRCAMDMDFEMVRTPDPDLFHPLLWKHSGHLELSGVRKRYRVTDHNAIQRCLMDTPPHAFREWYITASTDRWNSGEIAAEPWWHTALAVGSQQFCENIADTLPVSWLNLNVYPALKTARGLKETMCWTVNMSRKRTYEYVRSLVPKT